MKDIVQIIKARDFEALKQWLAVNASAPGAERVAKVARWMDPDSSSDMHDLFQHAKNHLLPKTVTAVKPTQEGVGFQALKDLLEGHFEEEMEIPVVWDVVQHFKLKPTMIKALVKGIEAGDPKAEDLLYKIRQRILDMGE